MGNYFKTPESATANKKFVKFFRKCNFYLTLYRTF